MTPRQVESFVREWVVKERPPDPVLIANTILLACEWGLDPLVLLDLIQRTLDALEED